jgi:hypothetical protein
MKILGIITFTILSAATGGYFYAIETPEYALYQVGESLNHKDRALFESYVDINTVTSNVVDEVVQVSLAKQSKKNSQSKWGAMGNMLAMKMVEAMKPQITNMIETEINTAFAEESRSPANSKSSKFEKIKEKIEYVDYNKKDCSSLVCFIDITFKNKVKKEDFVITAKLTKVNGSWKLVHFPGAVNSIMEMQKKTI